MKKKNLDDQMNFENFNKTLFDQSIKMINSHVCNLLVVINIDCIPHPKCWRTARLRALAFF